MQLIITFIAFFNVVPRLYFIANVLPFFSYFSFLASTVLFSFVFPRTGGGCVEVACVFYIIVPRTYILLERELADIKIYTFSEKLKIKALSFISYLIN